MPCIKYIERLKRIDKLVRLRNTGKPSDLGYRLGLSERSVFDYLKDLKALGAPINWSCHYQSYVYPDDDEFQLSFSYKNPRFSV